VTLDNQPKLSSEHQSFMLVMEDAEQVNEEPFQVNSHE
jgi:hypothetical protein